MNTSHPHSILIIKTSAIGDVIQTFPVLEYLRQKFPKAHIDWVAEQGIAPLLKAHPLIDRVLEIQTKSWRKTPFSKKTWAEFKDFVKSLRAAEYDLAVDLQGNAKSAVVTASAKAKIKLGFDWRSVREKSNLLATNKRLNVPANLNVRRKYLHLVQSYLNDSQEFKAGGVRLQVTCDERERLQSFCNQGPQLMICFGSKWANKRLDHSILTALLQRIAKEYAFSFLFIFGDEEEKKIADGLATIFGERGKAVGGLSLPLWQALMWEVNGMIAVDSAALHLCGTTQTPSFSVFGPSWASFYKPIEERHVSVQGTCPYGRTFTSRCPILRTCVTGACIRQLKIEDLFTSFKQWADAFL
jgi:heptosyltransferase I